MRGEHPFSVFKRLDWWLIIAAMAIVLVGLVFIHSATQYDPLFAGQHHRQTLFVLVSAGMGAVLVMIPYPRILRWSYVLYGAVIISLLLIPVFGTTINGARRWFAFPGFAIQPAEFAKIGAILAIAAWLRLRTEARLFENLIGPLLIAAVPALLIMQQPDLGSSLVFWPVAMAMAYAGGTRFRHILLIGVVGLLLVVFAYAFVLRDYQLRRIEAWQGHFTWDPETAPSKERVRIRNLIRGPAYQPWQSLIAIGSGGAIGYGVGQGPQNRYDFVPYRNADYIFSVIAEETGMLGVTGLLVLQMGLVVILLRIAGRTRERYGRIVVVGVAAYLGTQTVMHIAVCSWLVPSTGLPMPLISYGGSSTMASVLALALVLNVGAHRQPVVAGDGFR